MILLAAILVIRGVLDDLTLSIALACGFSETFFIT